jgi:uncharacterized protein
VAGQTIPLTQRYGHWAVVAGASEGLGEAFAEELAARGLHLILLARREEVLTEVAARIRSHYRVEVVTLACDLADGSFIDALVIETQSRDIGVIVYNAAYSYGGQFLDSPVDEALRLTDINVRGPLRFVHALAPGMVERKRGAIIIMSSLAGLTGSPKLAAYSASKAFLTTFAEGLWGELQASGIDVLAPCAGAITTPNYLKLRNGKRNAPGTLDAKVVVRQSLAALGKGPTVIPGSTNKLAYVFLRRVMPRKTAIKIMAKSVEEGA